jgi:hypothetical protein
MVSSRADGMAPSHEWIVVSGVSGLGLRQMGIRDSVFMNLGSRTTQALSKLVLQFSTWSFCSLGNDRRRAKAKTKNKKQKYMKREKQHSSCPVWQSAATAPGLLGPFYAIKR